MFTNRKDLLVQIEGREKMSQVYNGTDGMAFYWHLNKLITLQKLLNFDKINIVGNIEW